MVTLPDEMKRRYDSNPELAELWAELSEANRKWLLTIYSRYYAGSLSAEGVRAEVSALLLNHLGKKYSS